MADPDPLNFGVDLRDVRERLERLAYFLSVTDVLDSAEALDDTLPASPPAAFVGVSSERAEPNRMIQGHSQRVDCDVAILFVESAARMDRAAKDQLERTRKAVIRQLVAWKPKGTDKALDYLRYRVVKIGDGKVWAEVSFSTAYRLSI